MHVSCFIGSSNFAVKPCSAFVEMSLHVVDKSICVCVCYPIPCLSVENVSVTTTVPPTPTTHPITSHPTTPTLLTSSFAPDPKGNAYTPYYSASATLHLSPRPSLLSFGVFHSPAHLMTLMWPTHTHTHFFLLQPSFALHLHERTCLQTLGCASCATSHSLPLSYHWLFDAPHTHIAQSAFLCVCVCVHGHYDSEWAVSQGIYCQR